jgi:hypothetical protein
MAKSRGRSRYFGSKRARQIVVVPPSECPAIDPLTNFESCWRWIEAMGDLDRYEKPASAKEINFEST